MYRSIETSMWFDDKFTALGTEDRYLFMYLLTNPHTHVSGLYYLPFPTMTHETALADRVCRRGIDTLSNVGIAKYCSKFSLVWVVRYLEHQGKGKRIFRGCANHLRDLHNSPLVYEFLEFYPAVRRLIPDTLLKGYTDTVSEVGRDCPKEKDSKGSSLNPLEVLNPILTPERVRELWNTAGLRPCQKLTGPLLRSVKARIREHPEPLWWEALFLRVASSDFLCGRATDFVATLDWVCGPKNLAKIEAGNYDRSRRDGTTRMVESFLHEGVEP